MVLVDTSVWVGYFNGLETPRTERLDQLLGSARAGGLTRRPLDALDFVIEPALTAVDPTRSDRLPFTGRSTGGLRTFAERNCLRPAPQGILLRSAQDPGGAGGGSVG